MTTPAVPPRTSSTGTDAPVLVALTDVGPTHTRWQAAHPGVSPRACLVEVPRHGPMDPATWRVVASPASSKATEVPPRTPVSADVGADVADDAPVARLVPPPLAPTVHRGPPPRRPPAPGPRRPAPPVAAALAVAVLAALWLLLVLLTAVGPGVAVLLSLLGLGASLGLAARVLVADDAFEAARPAVREGRRGA